MARPVTLFTGQWADLPLEEVARRAGSSPDGWGYDGLELACWGDHFDVRLALADKAYYANRRDTLSRHGLNVWAISNHLVGQCVCDRIDERHRAIVPGHVWGDGDPEGVRRRAAQELMDTARAAAAMGVRVVNGFTGSSIWGDWYFFPPTPESHIDKGFNDFADRWGPILDVFAREGVRFALEVHPTEIAYDFDTTRRAIAAVNGHPAFAINFDPSHLVWPGMDPAAFIDAFADRIAHCHVKDVVRRLDGVRSLIGSHLPFGHPGRGWEFRSPGRGEVNFEEIIRALNRANYAGPLSVEWEDAGMDRFHGAAEAVKFVRSIDFSPTGRAFDAAFAERK